MCPEKSTDAKYSVITEQGDLGLGADVLSDEDQKTVAEAADNQ
jgi:hypothetical protein